MKPSPFVLLLLTATLLAIFVPAGLGQAVTPDIDQYSKPIRWTEYRLPSQKLSFLFPKLPVVLREPNFCTPFEKELFTAYADGAVYELAIYNQAPMPAWCSKKAKFSTATFNDRIGELKAGDPHFSESDVKIGQLSFRVLRSTTSTSAVKTRWLLWDKNRWLELGITRRNEAAVNEERFSSGLRLIVNGGIEVGSGEMAILGDFDADVESRYSESPTLGMVLITKPRPGYTEVARKSNVEGTVMLRVTFLRNGGIGAVSPIKTLPYGLTEQAIAAAKKIAFLPAIREGKPVSVVRQVEYTFSIF